MACKKIRWSTQCCTRYVRAAKLEPECDRCVAVSDGMHVILDFMLNDEWVLDTRFIFLEEDWRLHADVVQDPMSAEDVVKSMVQVAIAAANYGMRDFVWMSWEQYDKKDVYPTFGNFAQVTT